MTAAPAVPTPLLSNDPLPWALPAAADWALFVDLDGTLCPFRDDPADVALDDAQRAVLSTLQRRLDGALCVLSGRGRDDLERLLQGLDVERIGDHGHDAEAAVPDGLQRDLEAACARLGEVAQQHPHVWVEHKRASCALHYRRAPHLADRLIDDARRIVAALPRVRLLEGADVLEVCAVGNDKGSALRRMMRQARFAGRRPVAIGDDVTDEDAFVAANALGGFAIAVGPRVSQAARYRLVDTEAANAWLAALARNADAASVPRRDGLANAASEG